MPELLIPDLPAELHEKPSEAATLHHRSLSGEAKEILARALEPLEARRPLPVPFQGRRPLTQEILDEARIKGRR